MSPGKTVRVNVTVWGAAFRARADRPVDVLDLYLRRQRQRAGVDAHRAPSPHDHGRAEHAHRRPTRCRRGAAGGAGALRLPGRGRRLRHRAVRRPRRPGVPVSSNAPARLGVVPNDADRPVPLLTRTSRDRRPGQPPTTARVRSPWRLRRTGSEVTISPAVSDAAARVRLPRRAMTSIAPDHGLQDQRRPRCPRAPAATGRAVISPDAVRAWMAPVVRSEDGAVVRDRVDVALQPARLDQARAGCGRAGRRRRERTRRGPAGRSCPSPAGDRSRGTRPGG